MDKVTRHELKTDNFALEVQHGVEYLTSHRQILIKYGAIAVAAVLVIVGVLWYRSYQHTARAEALAAALQIQNAPVGPSQNELMISYPTQAEKDAAASKAFSDLAAKYSGSDTGYLAEFNLGSLAADKGDLAQAEKRFKDVADNASAPYASLAKLALGQIYASQGKVPEAQKIVQSVIDHPTVLVSKEEAIITLAQIIGPSNPQEARKLLEPLRGSSRSNISRAALSALSELPQK